MPRFGWFTLNRHAILSHWRHIFWTNLVLSDILACWLTVNSTNLSKLACRLTVNSADLSRLACRLTVNSDLSKLACRLTVNSADLDKDWKLNPTKCSSHVTNIKKCRVVGFQKNFKFSDVTPEKCLNQLRISLKFQVPHEAFVNIFLPTCSTFGTIWAQILGVNRNVFLKHQTLGKQRHSFSSISFPH